MWWAAHAARCERAIQDRWCASRRGTGRRLISELWVRPRAQPTQMAIPLQMESVPKQLVAAMWRA